MHIYIYDAFVNNNQKYQSITAKIETRITDLGLNGKIVRLSVITSLGETIENEIKKGAKTIVVVGDDSTFFEAANKMAAFFMHYTTTKKIPLGFIPVNNSSIIANKFGIPNNENACDVLSARRIKRFDLGLANNEFFLAEASIESNGTLIDIDQNYSIELINTGKLNIINFPLFSTPPEGSDIKPDDGRLELVIENNKGRGLTKKKIINQSVFGFKNLTVINKKAPLILDHFKQVKAPVTIQIASVKIDLIIGKNRNI